MAEEEKQGAPSTEDTSKDKGGNVGALRGLIREEMKNIIPELKDLFGSKGSDTPPPTQQQQQQDIKGEVARALEVLKTREARAERDKQLDEMLTAHQKAQKDGEVKAPVAPKETSRVHRFMGWGE